MIAIANSGKFHVFYIHLSIEHINYDYMNIQFGEPKNYLKRKTSTLPKMMNEIEFTLRYLYIS